MPAKKALKPKPGARRRSSAFHLGGITQVIRNRSFYKKLEHFLDHKSLQLLREMLEAMVFQRLAKELSNPRSASRKMRDQSPGPLAKPVRTPGHDRIGARSADVYRPKLSGECGGHREQTHCV
jgi:hypothetical protein